MMSVQIAAAVFSQLNYYTYQITFYVIEIFSGMFEDMPWNGGRNGGRNGGGGGGGCRMDRQNHYNHFGISFPLVLHLVPPGRY